jgi:hypothetical protein
MTLWDEEGFGYGDGYGDGYGYGEEGRPIIEQTSSSLSHYEIMTLVRLLAFGLGVTGDEEDPFLLQIKDNLVEIKDILLQSHQASEALRAEAQTVLDAHVESAQQYMQNVDQPQPPDYHPFLTMPAGTSVRELPDGGRLFTLADGIMVRVSPAGALTAISTDGTATELEPAKGGIVTLPDGRELTLKPEAVRVTHEAAGIEGLPLDIDPVQTSEDRYRVELPDGYRLDVSHGNRTALIGNPVGTVDVLSIIRIEGIGEKVTVRLVPGGAKGFSTQESGHKGIIEADGTIHLSMENGLDLVIRFPDGIGVGGDDGQDDQSRIICEECD